VRSWSTPFRAAECRDSQSQTSNRAECGRAEVGVGAGLCPIAANQPGNGHFTAAPQVTTLVTPVDVIFAEGFEEPLP
jgi:hypothetical protein